MNAQLQTIIDSSKNRMLSLATHLMTELVKLEPTLADDFHNLIDDAKAAAKTAVVDLADQALQPKPPTPPPAASSEVVLTAAPAPVVAPVVGINVKIH